MKYLYVLWHAFKDIQIAFVNWLRVDGSLATALPSPADWYIAICADQLALHLRVRTLARQVNRYYQLLWCVAKSFNLILRLGLQFCGPNAEKSCLLW
jgi:hypothetical protein